MSIRSFNLASPQCGARVYIDSAAVVIGQVKLGDDISIWPGAIVRGDMEAIVIGARTNVQDNAVLHTTHGSDFFVSCPLNIGKEVVIGHSAVLHGCTVGDNVLIGIGAIINDRTKIEDEVIVGAGSLVPPGKILGSGYMYVGNPVRQLRKLTEEEIAFLHYSPSKYVKLKDQYLAELK